MKRRSKASGGQIKGRRRKASVPNRGNVPKAVARSNSLTAGKAEEFARLVRELGEALERQAATTELLQVINSSYGDLQLVFQTMLASAVRLCQATFGVLWLAEGNRFRSVALHNLPPAFAAARQREPVVYFGPKSGTGRLIEKKQIFQIDDLTKDFRIHRARPAHYTPCRAWRCSYRPLRASTKREPCHRFSCALPPDGLSFWRQADRTRQELRRPSRHRHRERAVAQRTAAIAGKADGDVGCASSYQ